MLGKLPVSGLDERVLTALGDTAGEVAYTLTGFSDRLRRPALRLQLSVTVSVTCGRCLQPLPVALATDAVVTLFVSEEKMAEAVEEDDELDAIMAEPVLDVLALVEDEVIMGLPLSAVHDNCGTESLSGTRMDKPNPFGVLAALKSRKSE